MARFAVVMIVLLGASRAWVPPAVFFAVAIAIRRVLRRG